MLSDQTIQTGLGTFDKEKFQALINVRSATLESLREGLTNEGYTEVSTSSLVNVAGSCENPYASFQLNYYGRNAHLSQSAQLQLEALVIRLQRGVFTVNNSFREENYEDPETKGRRLSEFTLVEAEKPYFGSSAERILDHIMSTEESLVKSVVHQVLATSKNSVMRLGGDCVYLESILQKSFQCLSYDDAITILNRTNDRYSFGDDFGIAEERIILTHFQDMPTFVTHYPAKIKFFNMKRAPDNERVYSVDLLMPRLGETTGGAVREENGETLKSYLLESRIASFIKERHGDPLEPFREYFNLFEQEKPTSRGGFGIGLERLIGFLLNSNDILETIAYRSLQPKT